MDDRDPARRIGMGSPRHHPHWPRYCDRCGEPADGVPITRVIGAACFVGADSTYCRACHRIAIMGEESEDFPAWAVADVLGCTAGLPGAEAVFLDRATYRAKCVRA